MLFWTARLSLCCFASTLVLAEEPSGAVEAFKEELMVMQAKMQEQQIGLMRKIENLEDAISELASERRLETTITKDEVEGIQVCLDYMWLLLCGALVMFMQAGFALVEAGTCRRMNAGLVLTKNVVDACVGAGAWWVVGYGLAYGSENSNEFIGTSHFFGRGFSVDSTHHRDWFFQWAFCATAATIVSGAVAERIQFLAYVAYATTMTALIYPAVVYWTWSGAGFLSNMGYDDFAGSGIVHLTGGSAALTAAWIVGPRCGRWKPRNAKAFAPHDLSLVVMGTFILWFGWYGFNCGSTLAFSSKQDAKDAARVAMNTTLAAAAGGVTVLIVRGALTRLLDLGGACNGILAGLVAVCAGAKVVPPVSALLIGCLGGLAFLLGNRLVTLMQIDDPLDAAAVHGFAGFTGVLLRPLLDGAGADASMFGVHCLAALVICAWSGAMTFLVMYPLKLAGQLRLSKEEELAGGDKEELVSTAYSEAALQRGESSDDAENSMGESSEEEQ